jgi:hypothetical protein
MRRKWYVVDGIKLRLDGLSVLGGLNQELTTGFSKHICAQTKIMGRHYEKSQAKKI